MNEQKCRKANITPLQDFRDKRVECNRMLILKRISLRFERGRSELNMFITRIRKAGRKGTDPCDQDQW